MDLDEVMTVVSLNSTKLPPDWCGPTQPSLITKVLEQMLATATRYKLYNYRIMMNSFKNNDILSGTDACSMGMTYCVQTMKCRPITAFSMPVYLWIQGPDANGRDLPTIRSVYPCQYAVDIKGEPRAGAEEEWKSVYNTRYNPPLAGITLHSNGFDSPEMLYARAPRDFHRGLSLELVHQRRSAEYELSRDNITRLMTPDNRLVNLFDSYRKCMHNLKA